MTHTLIKTSRLDACKGICAPPPPIVWHRHTHNTTNNIRCQGWGGSDKRPNTSTAQTPPQCRVIAPPPFPCCGLGSESTLLVVLKVREGIHFLFAGTLFFLLVEFEQVH